MVQKGKMKKYWFKQRDLIKPIDWSFFNNLPSKVRNALELYMRGKISIGKACEIAEVSFREFDEMRAKARIPIRV